MLRDVTSDRRRIKLARSGEQERESVESAVRGTRVNGGERALVTRAQCLQQRGRLAR